MSAPETIFFNRPALLGDELRYMQEAIQNKVISGEGQFVRKCEAFMEKALGGSGTVLLTPSCTAALEMSALLLHCGPGDEIIMPSFTFVSTALAFAGRGARPVFAEIHPETLNIDPRSIENLITPKTKAIVVVHYAGYACEMEDILELGRRHRIPVVEDAAHAFGSKLDGRALGGLGRLGCFSFHETKNITCGEGGALAVNDPALVERAHFLRDKGTNRKQFQRGDAPFYTWVDLGSSYVMSDLLAAFLYAQMEHLEHVNAHRRALHAHYSAALAALRNEGLLAFPSYEHPESSSGHLFFILLPSLQLRKDLQAFLLEHKVYSLFHYQALHRSPFVEKNWGVQPALPVTERVAGCLLRLPMHNTLTLQEVDRCVGLIDQFLRGRERA